jgi:hypothetical protein
MRNEFQRVILCAVLAMILGCAADGGSTGTGISAIVSGNVVQVDSSQDGANDLPAVHVSIDEVPGVEATTDEEGTFELSGDFAGSLTLRFSTADLSVTQAIDVPAGSVIVLEDITVRRPAVRIGTARQLGFFGTVALVDCAAGEVVVDDRGASPRQFLVRLSNDTAIIRGDGGTAECTEIGAGDEIAVEGAIRFSDRTIDAATLTLDPGRPGNPSPLIELRFRGEITLINCESGMIMIDAPSGMARLRLSAESEIIDLDRHPIECSELMVGERVEGRGIIRVRRPGVIDVIGVRVLPPTPG